VVDVRGVERVLAQAHHVIGRVGGPGLEHLGHAVDRLAVLGVGVLEAGLADAEDVVRAHLALEVVLQVCEDLRPGSPSVSRPVSQRGGRGGG
jgi:hypothetical protein